MGSVTRRSSNPCSGCRLCGLQPWTAEHVESWRTCRLPSRPLARFAAAMVLSRPRGGRPDEVRAAGDSVGLGWTGPFLAEGMARYQGDGAKSLFAKLKDAT